MTLSQEVVQAREMAKTSPVYALYSLISGLRWEMIVVESNFIILKFKSHIHGETVSIPLNRIMDAFQNVTLDDEPWLEAMDTRDNTMDIILKEGVDGESLMHQMAYLDWLQRPYRLPGNILISHRDDENDAMSMSYSAYVTIKRLERTLSMHYPRPSPAMTGHSLWPFYKVIEGRNWSMSRDGTFYTTDPILVDYLPAPYNPTTRKIDFAGAYEILQWMELTQHPWRTDFPWDDILIHEPI